MVGVLGGIIMKYLILTGLSGAGKTSIAKYCEGRFGAKTFYLGDMLEALDQISGTPLPNDDTRVVEVGVSVSPRYILQSELATPPTVCVHTR